MARENSEEGLREHFIELRRDESTLVFSRFLELMDGRVGISLDLRNVELCLTHVVVVGTTDCTDLHHT